MAKNQPKPILADSRYTVAQWIEGKAPKEKLPPKFRHRKPKKTYSEDLPRMARERGARGSPVENRIIERFRNSLHSEHGKLHVCYEATFESGVRADALFYTRNDLICCEAKVGTLTWREIGQAIGYGLETRSLAYSLGHESVTIHAVIVIKDLPASYPKQNLVSIWTPDRGRVSTGVPVHLWPKELGFLPRKSNRQRKPGMTGLALRWLASILGDKNNPHKKYRPPTNTHCKGNIEYLP